MDFSDYSVSAARTATYPKRGEFVGLLYTVLGLAGEAGELANKVKKIMRDNNFTIDKDTREGLLEELGDILWYADRTAVELNSTLSEVAVRNNEKLMSRLKRGTLNGSGDYR